MWLIELIGPIISEYNENRFILVVIDYYTKWIETASLPNKSAKSAVPQIKRLVIEKYRVPETILSDNDLKFKTKAQKIS